MVTQKSSIKTNSVPAANATSPLNSADFTNLVPEKRPITIGGEVFDVAIIPVAVTLKMSDMLTFKGGITAQEMASLTVDVLRAARKDLAYVSLEWIEEVCDGVTFMKVIDYVMRPAKDLFFPKPTPDSESGSGDEKNTN